MAEFDDEIDIEAVRLTAYFLWEQEGYPENRAQDFWYEAWAIHRRALRNQQELQRGPKVSTEGETGEEPR